MKTVRVRDQEERSLVLGIVEELRMSRWQRFVRSQKRVGRIVLAILLASLGGKLSMSGGPWWETDVLPGVCYYLTAAWLSRWM